MKRLLLIVLLLSLGCDEEKTSVPPPFFPDTGEEDMGNNNVPDVSEDVSPDAEPDATNNNTEEIRCDDVTCQAGEKCVRGDCVDANAKLACDEVQALGTIDTSAPYTITGDTTGFVDTLSTTCGMAGDFNGAENAFSFQLDKDAIVTLDLTTTAAVNWLMEVRKSGCLDGSDIAICNTSENITFPAQAGQTYTLIVEPQVGFDKGAFSIEMSFVEAVCSPPGSRVCVDGDLEECRAGTSIATLECSDGCMDSACLGDRCETAIEVTASTSFSGEIIALHSNFNLADSATCGTNGTGIESTGQDMVLKLTGLTEGQIVTVDASMDTMDDVIAVVKDCTAALACERAVDLGDKLTWTVPTAGDWYVIVDKRLPASGTYSFTVDIQ